MSDVETNIDEAAEQVELRELWSIATMIKRRQDEEAQGPEPTTYLGMQVSAPVDRAGQRPQVTGAAEMVVLPAPAWSHDRTGIEPPLGIDISELPALGGASEPLRCVEVSAPQVSGDQTSNSDGEQ
jgi:hypothetical protein